MDPLVKNEETKNNIFPCKVTKKNNDNKNDKKNAPLIKKETNRYGTRYEKAKILGVRATELTQGKPITIDLGKCIQKTNNPQKYTDPLEIAREELKQGTLPINIKRIKPDGSVEYWKVSELIWTDD